MKRTPLLDRMDAALAKGPLGYHDLMRAVFPPEEYPRAWRSSSNGGPPGCAMAFGMALRRGGFPLEDGESGLNADRVILPRKIR